jgi:hypothetical protein
MLHRIRRVSALSRVELAKLLHAFMLLVLVDMCLRIRGFRQIAGWAPPVSTSVIGAAAFEQAQRYARWIDVAARYYVVPLRCLPRSLTLHIWLRREGIPSDLCIGVHRLDGEFTAHAWVELDGRPANEVPEAIAAFTRLAGPIGQSPDWTGAKWTNGVSPRALS